MSESRVFGARCVFEVHAINRTVYRATAKGQRMETHCEGHGEGSTALEGLSLRAGRPSSKAAIPPGPQGSTPRWQQRPGRVRRKGRSLDPPCRCTRPSGATTEVRKNCSEKTPWQRGTIFTGDVSGVIDQIRFVWNRPTRINLMSVIKTF